MRGGVLSAVLEPVALAVYIQDVDMVGEPFRAEDLGPFVEGLVGGHLELRDLPRGGGTERVRGQLGKGEEIQGLTSESMRGQTSTDEAPRTPGNEGC